MSDTGTTGKVPAARRLPATLRLGAVHLIVSDLDRSIAWYESALGLGVHRRDAGEAELGDGTDPVIVLREDDDEASRFAV